MLDVVLLSFITNNIIKKTINLKQLLSLLKYLGVLCQTIFYEKPSEYPRKFYPFSNLVIDV